MSVPETTHTCVCVILQFCKLGAQEGGVGFSAVGLKRLKSGLSWLFSSWSSQSSSSPPQAPSSPPQSPSRQNSIRGDYRTKPRVPADGQPGLLPVQKDTPCHQCLTTQPSSNAAAGESPPTPTLAKSPSLFPSLWPLPQAWEICACQGFAWLGCAPWITLQT